MEDGITCEVCSKIYKTMRTYRQHITYKRCNKVIVPKPVFSICQYCEKDFKTKQNRLRHEERCSKNVNLEVSEKIKLLPFKHCVALLIVNPAFGKGCTVKYFMFEVSVQPELLTMAR